MKMPKPTMMDVAARAGVSQATVSLILNGSPGARFSEETRRRVRDAAEALGYHLVQRGPAGAESSANQIAFVVDELTSDPWTALSYEGAREYALERGVTVTLSVSRSARLVYEEHLKHYETVPLIGMLYATTLTREISLTPAFFRMPTVLVNCYDAKRRLPSVLPGDVEGGRTATQRLIAAGRRRIGFINGQEGIDCCRDRLLGYRQALASSDISFDPDLVWNGNWEPPAGYEGTRAFLALPEPPDAIFCGNDTMAIGCYEALKEAGLRIPQDISVIGFDDREIAQFMRPPLTTLLMPQYDVGAAAAALLLDQVGGLTPRHNQLKLECELVERQSVA